MQTEFNDGDVLFRYDELQGTAIQQQKPWGRNPHFFKHVRITGNALIKMAKHCRSGGNLEVMGMLCGKTAGDTFLVLDCFALPVVGTETRVNAQAEAYEYMVSFVQARQQVGRREHVIGWYHSHPGYGCWMSGIDCSTQLLNQQYTEPFVALVIDPVRTCASGRVNVGAFRTFPLGYSPPDDTRLKYQTVPTNKIKDFGVHANQYYCLNTSFFKSSRVSAVLAAAWNNYWVNTLSSSPLHTNQTFVAGQITDIAEKVMLSDCLESPHQKKNSVCTSKVAAAQHCKLLLSAYDGSIISMEQTKGSASRALKESIFNFAVKLGKVLSNQRTLVRER